MDSIRRRHSFAEEEGYRRVLRERFIKSVTSSDVFKPLVLLITSDGARATAAGTVVWRRRPAAAP